MSGSEAGFPLPPPAFSGVSRKVAAGNAFEWLQQGWALFAAAPGIWIAMSLLLLVILFAVQVVPVFGHLAAALLAPVLTAGALHGCRRLANDEALEVSDLFWGFRQRSGSLMLLGVLALAATLMIMLAVMIFVGGGLMAGFMAGPGQMGSHMGGFLGSGSGAGLGMALGSVLFGLLVSLLAGVPLSMALWFAPALVAFHDMPPVNAVKASFSACLRNWLPMSVLGLMLTIASFFAVIPLGLGLLLLIPIVIGAIYASYRDLFVAS
jgi:uncharacterized membrane protein